MFRVGGVIAAFHIQPTPGAGWREPGGERR